MAQWIWKCRLVIEAIAFEFWHGILELGGGSECGLGDLRLFELEGELGGGWR